MYFDPTHPHENAGLWTSLDYAKANRKWSAKVNPLATLQLSLLGKQYEKEKMKDGGPSFTDPR